MDQTYWTKQLNVVLNMYYCFFSNLYEIPGMYIQLLSGLHYLGVMNDNRLRQNNTELCLQEDCIHMVNTVVQI